MAVYPHPAFCLLTATDICIIQEGEKVGYNWYLQNTSFEDRKQLLYVICVYIGCVYVCVCKSGRVCHNAESGYLWVIDIFSIFSPLVFLPWEGTMYVLFKASGAEERLSLHSEN